MGSTWTPKVPQTTVQSQKAVILHTFGVQVSTSPVRLPVSPVGTHGDPIVFWQTMSRQSGATRSAGRVQAQVPNRALMEIWIPYVAVFSKFGGPFRLV